MAIPMPRAKSEPVEERVMRRDFVPEGEPYTNVEQSSFKFGADPLEVAQQFVPDDDSAPTQPLGNPDKQLAQAAALVKKATKETAEAEESGAAELDRINVLSNKNYAEAIAYIESKSDHERALWLEAERKSRKRKTVLGHFGVA